jgi:hypothetical protein
MRLRNNHAGVSTFDIQLHNPNKTILNGFLPLAQRVPLKKFTSGSRKGQFGGELGIDLDATAGLGGMVGDGFSLIFMDTVSGTVYHKSKKFPIYAGAESPANYTTASESTVTSFLGLVVCLFLLFSSCLGNDR